MKTGWEGKIQYSTSKNRHRHRGRGRSVSVLRSGCLSARVRPSSDEPAANATAGVGSGATIQSIHPFHPSLAWPAAASLFRVRASTSGPTVNRTDRVTETGVGWGLGNRRKEEERKRRAAARQADQLCVRVRLRRRPGGGVGGDPVSRAGGGKAGKKEGKQDEASEEARERHPSSSPSPSLAGRRRLRRLRRGAARRACGRGVAGRQAGRRSVAGFPSFFRLHKTLFSSADRPLRPPPRPRRPRRGSPLGPLAPSRPRWLPPPPVGPPFAFRHGDHLLLRRR